MQFEDSHAAAERLALDPGCADPFEAALQPIRKQLALTFKSEQLAQAGPEVCAEAGRLARDGVRTYNQEAVTRGLPRLLLSEEQFIDRALSELLGMGAIEDLLQDRDVEDIAINGPQEVLAFRHGAWHPTPIRFSSETRLLEVLNRGMAHAQRRANAVTPIAEAFLRSGPRISVVTDPIASPHPTAVIRIPRAREILLADLVRPPAEQEPAPVAQPFPDYSRLLDGETSGMLSPAAALYLHAAVRCGLNLAAIGPTGSGKTTLLMALGRLIPQGQRILIIEDTPEISLHPGETQPHNVLYLRTRPATLEGLPAISQADLVRLALRQRPDALTLGEARGAEVFDLLNALNTGHRNGLTSLHAFSVEEVFDRVYLMLAQSERGRFLDAARAARLVASTLHILVALEMNGSVRRIRTIAELTGRVQQHGTSFEPQLQLLFHRDSADGPLRGPRTRSIHHERFQQAGAPALCWQPWEGGSLC